MSTSFLGGDVTFTFPLPPNLANARMHWREKHRLHRVWKLTAVALDPSLRAVPKEPLDRVKVTAKIYVKGVQMDPDNAVSRLKWVWDLLKERGFIVDDSPKHLEMEMPEQFKANGSPRVEVMVEAV